MNPNDQKKMEQFFNERPNEETTIEYYNFKVKSYFVIPT